VPKKTNLMDALKYLQKALDAGTVRMQRCEIYPNLRVLVDEPNGDLRLTYAKVIAGTVQSIAVFVLTKSVGRVGRFSLGFAVKKSIRGLGLAKEIVVQSIDELLRGMTRNGMREFYVLAAVPESNIPANRVARQVLSDSPERATSLDFDEPTLIYQKLITTASGGLLKPIAKPQIHLSEADIIPEQTVVAVSHEVRSLSPDEVAREIERVAHIQPASYAFLTPFSSDLSPDAMHMGRSMFVAIVRMFEKHFGERLQSATPQPLKPMLAENFLKLDNLIDPDKRPPSRLNEELSKQQPAVWRYVADTLFEWEPGLKLPQEDQGELALIMTTVIQALNDSVSPIKR
jgi:hypothetical protein